MHRSFGIDDKLEVTARRVHGSRNDTRLLQLHLLADVDKQHTGIVEQLDRIVHGNGVDDGVGLGHQLSETPCQHVIVAPCFVIDVKARRPRSEGYYVHS